MRVMFGIVSCCVFFSLAVSAVPAQGGAKSETFHTEGVFSNITVGSGGDYSGMQVYLTDADGQFYATVTLAEGILMPPVLVKARVQVEERKIEFALAGEDGPRKFTGTVTAAGLTLTENGRRYVLKRKCYE